MTFLVYEGDSVTWIKLRNNVNTNHYLRGGKSMYCELFGKELIPVEENEQYPWVNVDCYLYCL